MTLHDPTPAHIAALAELLDPAGVLAITDDAAQPFLAEPRDRYSGKGAAVLRPADTAAVARVVRYCNEHRIGIIPFGGGTGLVGGQVQETGPAPVILSVERLNRIRSVAPDDGALIAEAGVILADIQAAAEDAGQLFPLSLAAEGSCRIGGNLATNAGGVQVLRYGNARDLCLGIEAVMPSGEVFNGLRTLRKDNTGYDIRNLLIGSEGTLGIITAAALKLFPRPGETMTAMLAVPDPATAVTLLKVMRDRLGDGVTAFELIGGLGIAFLAEFHPERTDPLSSAPDWRVLVEITGATGSNLTERAEAVLEQLFEEGLATDGVIASSEAQRQELWWFRETIPEANRRVGGVSNHDISVPISHIPAFITEGVEAVAAIDPGLRINTFGHLGDGNLHYNVFPAPGKKRADYDALRGTIKTAIHDLVDAHQGSVSAEHGIGRLKTGDLVRYGDPVKVAAMRAIKAALDPNGIMNPGAVLDTN